MKIRRKTLQAVLPASSADASRYNLCGVNVTPAGAFIATDGHRLHMVEQDQTLVEEQDPREQLEEPCILPRAGLKALEKGMPKGKAIPEELRDSAVLDCAETNHNGHARIRTGGAQYDLEKVVGEYPDYRQVMPDGEGTTFGVNAKYLRDACDAVLKFNPTSRSNAVKITVKDELSPILFECDDVDTGDKLTIVVMPTRI